MPSLKLYYLAAEVAPFSDTYHLASFSRKITNMLHLKTDIDIRVSQPKYGYISERKYILREVIRLRDLPIIFNNEKHIINMKSAFIPETRVQVYFVENNSLYKELPELIYKARNGRIFSDIDKRFSFFNKAALDTLQSLFWTPDIIICNDWQTSLIPTLLKKQFIKKDFYSNIKSVYVIHSINNYRKFAKSTYDILGLEPVVANQKQIDNHMQAMEHADLTPTVFESALVFAMAVLSDLNVPKDTKAWQMVLVRYESDTNDDDWHGGGWAVDLRWQILNSYLL